MADGPVCPGCGAAWAGGTPEFRATCPGCGAWVHVCLACAHFDPAAHHECRASATTEYIADKVKFNYCEEFRHLAGVRPGTGGATLTRAQADKLFPGLS